ncbi:MAG: alpha-L-arabinofuranosidase A [Thermoguttaceae bacterium]
MDEWNYWYGTPIFGELGSRYFLRDALGIAAGLNEYSRQSDIIFMANYAQTVNVIGCIKTSGADAAFETTGLVLKLYRREFGSLPVAATAGKPLDVAAAWTADHKTLTISIVNPTFERLELPLKLNGATLRGPVRRWQIAGSDPLAFNEPGKAAKVVIESADEPSAADRLWVAPCSVTLYALSQDSP